VIPHLEQEATLPVILTLFVVRVVVAAGEDTGTALPVVADFLAVEVAFT